MKKLRVFRRRVGTLPDWIVSEVWLPKANVAKNCMLAAGVNVLLRQLGLAVNGGLEDKKKRLRRHIGLMVLWVHFVVIRGLIYLQAAESWFALWRNSRLMELFNVTINAKNKVAPTQTHAVVQSRCVSGPLLLIRQIWESMLLLIADIAECEGCIPIYSLRWQTKCSYTLLHMRPLIFFTFSRDFIVTPFSPIINLATINWVLHKIK